MWLTGALLCAGLDFVFHMFFLVKYSKSLEEGSFRGRSADFLWMLLFGKSSYAYLSCISSQSCLCPLCLIAPRTSCRFALRCSFLCLPVQHHQ